ncbi:MAG: acyl-CoA dehydrogenase family protein [Dehalococcoidia bacterium]|jgi:cyclohexanecarboxyl-CoA dehydrogenase|nr:acyl-CoA dehydrogenase family protein [Dehalococcoidia bacterium]MDP7470638.1 acyl-CoA dehydrogenase family protein [Dehalococcoidia bacterium]
MGEFTFTEAQNMFQRQVRDFARKELLPGAKERAKQDTMDTNLVKRMGDMGLLGLTLPQEYGGTPGDWVMVGITVEEIARADFSLSLVPHQVIGCGLGIVQGSDEAKEKWLPPLISGEKLVALCLTEPGCGSDAAAIQTTATRTGDGYLLRGEKTSITLGMQSEVAVVFAKSDPKGGARGVSAFLVPTDSKGLSRSGMADTGCKPMGRSSYFFDDVMVPENYRLGDEGKGFYTVMGQFDFIRNCLGLETLGAAEASLDEAIEYAKTRQAFGRPIGKFEGVSFKLAEAATMIEAARLICFRALWLMDQGRPHTKETAMCKWLAPKVAWKVIHDCLLIHGQVAYSLDLPIEQRLMDIMGWEIGDGTEEVMKVIIGRELLGREYLPYDR